MQKNKFDISVVVTAHHEGRLAHRTMRSLFRSTNYAKEKGVTTEIIVVMDRPDKNTEEYFSLYKSPEIFLKTVDFSDLGLSRNFGVGQASGKYIAILDADDLLGKNWLYEAYKYIKDNNCKEIILHPQYFIVFEALNLIWPQLSSTDNKCFLTNLIEFNYWASTCITSKEILSKYPYEITTQGSGFGYEDWYWNCQTLADAIRHHYVSGTVNFIRKKKTGSLLLNTNQGNRIIRPTKLFEPQKFSSMYKDENRMGDNPIHEEGNSWNKIVQKKNLKHRLLHPISSLQNSLYRQLPDFLKPLFHSFPILYKVVRQFRGSTKVSNRPKDILPEWLINEWKAIHEIEPQIFPEKWLVQTIPINHIPKSNISGHYIDICQQYGKNVSHVFLVPWLKTGGADLETLNYIDAIVKYNLGNNVVVIATNDTDSPWAKRLTDKARFIEFGKICSSLTAEEQEKLLTRVLLQMAPHAVHNINSDLGYRIFVKYGSALKSISNLYANSFCKDVTEEGKSVGYPFMYLPECFDHLMALASDNQSFLDYLYQTYAFDKQKMFAHYQPVQMLQKRIYRYKATKEYLDILWAGRMDRQKRPDILERIAIDCSGLPFRFHVYGSSVLDKDKFTKRLKQLKNVKYYGAYDGMSSLPIEQYDIFLYTSQWDGLPNVLLEAVSLGLPVVASNAGGIGELIVSGKTGFLIDPYDDVKAYVDCLKKIYDDRSQLNEIINNAYDLIYSRHSWERFAEDLKKFPDYVVGH